MKKLFMVKAMMALATVAVSQQAFAGNINESAARNMAKQFIQQQVSAGTFKASRGVNLALAHAEASAAVAGAHDYYAYNLEGGGWIIVAGEDRAATVLGYSDQGELNFNNLPCNFEGLLNGYKREIEFLQTYTDDDLVPRPKTADGKGRVVNPLIQTNWGQEMPYYLQCPIYQNEYCVVGCVATAMAQVMKYWQYPQECNGVARYYCYDIGGYLSALPATTFNYNLMLDSYCHWDYNTSTLVQDTYTDAQAQEVAKLSRYCGQAVEMSYSPEGSGAYTWDQLDAMNNFGYSSAELVEKGGWYGSDNYTTAEWETMLLTELRAGRPVLYSASDPAEGGHAFICDGYNGEDKFHFNFGWYGTCDGWYVSTALDMVHREGDELHFNSNHDMIIGIKPPEGWQPPVTVVKGDVNGDGEVDVRDITALIDIIMNSGTDAAADVNEDSAIDVRDITALIDLIMNV